VVSEAFQSQQFSTLIPAKHTGVMDDMHAKKFRERTAANWTDPQTVAAWRRWHGQITRQMQATSDALIEAAAIRPGMRVLDLASGSGEPALQIATIVGPDGHVVATDLSAEMLEIAQENAVLQELTNVSFQTADAERLPFADESFDAITCRMGVMFFYDLQPALTEIRRVLRPSGRVAFSAWGPLERNMLFGVFLDAIGRRCELPQPPPGVPQPMRFAENGSLSRELVSAGYADVREQLAIQPAPFFGSPEENWEAFYELGMPPAFDDLSEADRLETVADILDHLRRLHDDGAVRTEVAAVIASAAR
jgi:SAM-dependent methyltransferase